MRPNFEDPLDTAKQLVEKNISLYNWPGAEMWTQFLLDSPIPEYNILGEGMVDVDNWDLYYSISEQVIGNGKYAIMTPLMGLEELEMGEWYRSEERVSGYYPYGGYLTNKKWSLNEVDYHKIRIDSNKANQSNSRQWLDIYYVSNK